MIDNTDIYSQNVLKELNSMLIYKNPNWIQKKCKKTYLRWIQFRFVNRTIYYGWLKSKDLVGVEWKMVLLFHSQEKVYTFFLRNKTKKDYWVLEQKEDKKKL